MEHIKSALQKAGVLSENHQPAEKTVTPVQVKPSPTSSQKVRDTAPPALRTVKIDPKHLEKKRIVSQSMSDPNHIAFNLLRTRVRKAMFDNKWKTLAVTSPTPGCGKTMVSLNLAFSLARSPGLKTVLVDLDLKRPSIAPTLNVEPKSSIAQFLLGRAKPEDCFVQVDENLIVGLNSGHTPSSSELIQAPNMLDLFSFIQTSLTPDVVVFDLPPMRSSDDALAFLPRVDTALLVVAAGTTTTTEVDECELQISELDKLLGLVLNKCENASTEEYYY
ncbi:CpsD/CapB family tyrosine-protein kinase [Roseibium aggregatum]|uniref:CpsD/CapB family tyrosine-protein kinase n=1 Tax=Roseibium aggregatum TaxID=187304 RepID=A0A939J2T7_9HYPH|nr:CpsD/CapB family tyrosine-protein kinase [Roseibium aggregatum]MBN9669882.1 CpsD/CapB family tyrosine-protein kinase [Roseibium aggregatum]